MSHPPAGPVRLSVTKVDLQQVGEPGELLLELEEPDAHAAQVRATAWASVRGYDRLSKALENVLDREPPASGYAVLINKTHSLLILATWPWSPASMR